MKICFVAPASNYHTIKWANWFSSRGHEVHVVSFVDSIISGSTVHYINTGVSVKDSDSKKIKYLFFGRRIKHIVDEINPDIVNVHYATSYGAAVAFSGLRGYVLSIWGSDIFDFPRKSIMHKLLVKYSLLRAGYIFSTSTAMAQEAHKYTKKNIEITPFGVDVDLFNPSKRCSSKNTYIVGTVKALYPKYGIDYLLNAVALVVNERPDIPIRVRIAGNGPLEQEYKELAKRLRIDGIVTWLGFISQEQVAIEWANMDVGIIASTLESESFGVSAIEAEACGTAVIISDIPGLMEATKPGITSVVVPRKNSIAISKALIDLYDNPEKRFSLGKEGRKYIESTFELNKCFKKPEYIFENLHRRCNGS